MDWLIPIIGWLFVAILVTLVLYIVGTILAAIGNLVAGLLGHPWHGSQESPQTGRPPIPLALRTRVLNRDGWRCVYCGSGRNLQMDHIIPFSKGGATTYDNLETLCKPCNERKGAT